MSPDKAAKANQEVQNLLALGLIQPSYSPWASGIVMVKKKNGELRFCCDFRPLNDVTAKDAFPLLRIDESLSRIGNAKIFTSIDFGAENSFINPEFASRGFHHKKEFVEHQLARQQEIYELVVSWNTHQAQLRQKQKFDRHLKAKAHAVGDAVWVCCHIIPRGGTRKLIRAWRGPHKVTDVLQDGRQYVLDTDQKVHSERLEKQVPAPWD